MAISDNLNAQQILQRLDRLPQFARYGILAGVALAVVGLYGVVAYSAAQRTHDIGIRMALGATRRNVLAMIVRHGLWLVAAGSLLGAPTVSLKPAGESRT